MQYAKCRLFSIGLFLLNKKFYNVFFSQVPNTEEQSIKLWASILNRMSTWWSGAKPLTA